MKLREVNLDGHVIYACPLCLKTYKTDRGIINHKCPASDGWMLDISALKRVAAGLRR
jgi:hypothetical protein